MARTNTARLYHCTRCHRQVMICSYCDRGNCYCFKGCAEAALKERCQRNARRYQRSKKGRHANARRQRRWRERQRSKSASNVPANTPVSDPVPPAGTKNITHRGSVAGAIDAPLAHRDNRVSTGDSAVDTLGANDCLRCDQCQRVCDPFLRIDFVHTRANRSAHSSHNTDFP